MNGKERKMSIADVNNVTAATTDAYSRESYQNWRACVDMLAHQGYDAREAEAILRSKYTRWAGDASVRRFGCYTSIDLLRFLENNPDLTTKAAIADLVAGTFTGENR